MPYGSGMLMRWRSSGGMDRLQGATSVEYSLLLTIIAVLLGCLIFAGSALSEFFQHTASCLNLDPSCQGGGGDELNPHVTPLPATPSPTCTPDAAAYPSVCPDPAT